MVCVAEGVHMCTYIVDVSFFVYWEYKLKFISLGPGNVKLSVLARVAGFDLPARDAPR